MSTSERDEFGRVRQDSGRRKPRKNRIGNRGIEFINPYPWMSNIEAMVHLFLEQRQVPFTWRYFDGQMAPHIKELMPSWAPEFTLTEYKTCIAVQGSFWGHLPGVLDVLSLAGALLEMSGWKLVVVWETDLRHDLQGTLEAELPWLKNPPIKGKPRLPPMGRPDFMSGRREQLRAQAMRRAHYALDEQEQRSRGRTDTSGRRRRRNPRRAAARQRRREGG